MLKHCAVSRKLKDIIDTKSASSPPSSGSISYMHVSLEGQHIRGSPFQFPCSGIIRDESGSSNTDYCWSWYSLGHSYQLQGWDCCYWAIRRLYLYSLWKEGLTHWSGRIKTVWLKSRQRRKYPCQYWNWQLHSKVFSWWYSGGSRGGAGGASPPPPPPHPHTHTGHTQKFFRTLFCWPCLHWVFRHEKKLQKRLV